MKVKVHSTLGTSEVQVDPEWSLKKYSKEILGTKKLQGVMLAPGERLVGLLTKNKSEESVKTPYRMDDPAKEESLEDLPYLQVTQVWTFPSEEKVNEEIEKVLSIHRQSLINQVLFLREGSSHYQTRATTLRDQANQRWKRLKGRLSQSYQKSKKDENKSLKDNTDKKETQTPSRDKKETKSPIKK